MMISVMISVMSAMIDDVSIMMMQGVLIRRIITMKGVMLTKIVMKIKSDAGKGDDDDEGDDD